MPTQDSENYESNLVGSIDRVESGKGFIAVYGWGFERNNDNPIDIHVYIGGEAGSGAPGYVVTAGNEREDVGQAYGVGNNHGFSAIINTDRFGEQTVYFYATCETGILLLGSRTVTIEEDKIPVGSIDVAL